MSDFQSLWEVIKGGADVMPYLIAYFLWRLDRRIFTIEVITGIVKVPTPKGKEG